MIVDLPNSFLTVLQNYYQRYAPNINAHRHLRVYLLQKPDLGALLRNVHTVVIQILLAGRRGVALGPWSVSSVHVNYVTAALAPRATVRFVEFIWKIVIYTVSSACRSTRRYYRQCNGTQGTSASIPFIEMFRSIYYNRCWWIAY